MIARLKVALWRRCLAAYRAKPVVPVLRDRKMFVCVYIIIMLVERFVLTEIKIVIIIIIMLDGFQTFRIPEPKFTDIVLRLILRCVIRAS